jgi:hypothetical protein
MSTYLYFIGKDSDYKDFSVNPNDITKLPVKNLPMSYFPFFYETSEKSIERMRKLVPLFENYTKTTTSDGQTSSQNNIDTEKLFGLLSQLEEPYQPFNKNNVTHIFMMTVFIWMVVVLIILKLLSAILDEYYTYFIMGLIILLSIIGIIWSFFVTNTVL